MAKTADAPRHVTLELCIDSLDSALKAAPFMRDGDRFEVCSSLISGGGLTPSMGLITQLRSRLPQFGIMAMVRPRTGGFVYTASELEVMLADIAAFKSAGVQGVVFGCLTAEGEVDVEAARRLVDAAQPLEVTFHRAFDVTVDWERGGDVRDQLTPALKDIESVGGITRILTSGHSSTAPEGAAEIAALCQAASIGILPGSGVNSSTVSRLLQIVPVSEVHLTAGSKVEPAKTAILAAGETFGFGLEEWHLDVAKLEAMREVLDS